MKLENTLDIHDRYSLDILQLRFLYKETVKKLEDTYQISRPRLYKLFKANKDLVDYFTDNAEDLIARRKEYSDRSNASTRIEK